MSRVKIYEMFLRDGLQSYPKIFDVPKKLFFLNQLQRCNFDCIEFGSTTSPKLIPQMSGSFELWDSIKQQKITNNTKYTMLVPSINHLDKVIKEGMNSFGFVCSISDEFSKRNMKMSSEESIQNILKMCERTILENNKNHIRVYISCSFGCPWEGFNKLHLLKLKYFIDKLVDFAESYRLSSEQFDIILADTVGFCDEETIRNILEINKDNKYLGLHMHFKYYLDKKGNLVQNFEEVIDRAITMGIEKYDSSLIGIGGCPYAKSDTAQIIGNLSTVPFIKFLHKHGIQTNVDLKKLNRCEHNVLKEI